MAEPTDAPDLAAPRGRTAGMGEVEAVRHRTAIDAPFGKALVALQKRRGDVVGLSADLAKYTDILPFAEACPDRFFNVGMSEQNLIAMGAGLAKTGWVPYCTTYGVFATRRAYDFIAIACAHSRANVKIFAGLPGLTTGYGGTHQAIEDLALMRMVPDLAVIDPCDATELAQVVEAVAGHDGPAYVRLLRGTVPVVLDPAAYRFVLGKAQTLRGGTDVGVIASGLMTERALDAAAALDAEGLSVGVLHVPTLKPFDAAAACDFASGVGRLVTAENHVTRGGLASQVAEALFDARIDRPLTRVGLPDRFVECGSLPYLQDKHGLSLERVTAAIRAAAR